jgi:hypothetical protein
MPLSARRTFRLAAVVALSLALAYGLAMPLPFFAPLFALLLTATPAAPMGLKGLLGLALVVIVTLGVGLLLTPLLDKYPVPALLIIAAGLYLSTHVSIGLRKGLVGALLAIGFTLIPAAGLVEYALAVTVIHALLIGIGIAVLSQWIVYPFFPEDLRTSQLQAPQPGGAIDTHWISLRSVLIVLPPVLLAFSNPALYLPLIMKSVLLSQQGSEVSARTAGREMLVATLLAGLFAILLWFALKLSPNLWMFFLLMLLAGIYFAGKLYGVLRSRYSPSFWSDVVVNLLIMLGPAVEDSAAGNDVYRAFAVRFSLFIAVTLYAWAAISALEWLRGRRISARLQPEGSRG